MMPGGNEVEAGAALAIPVITLSPSRRDPSAG
jgi:hypothetical protein